MQILNKWFKMLKLLRKLIRREKKPLNWKMRLIIVFTIPRSKSLSINQKFLKIFRTRSKLTSLLWMKLLQQKMLKKLRRHWKDLRALLWRLVKQFTHSNLLMIKLLLQTSKKLNLKKRKKMKSKKRMSLRKKTKRNEAN